MIHLQNYESCFDRADGLSNKEELSRPYEIINRTGGVGITIPINYHAVFVFNVKVLDPDYRYVQKELSTTLKMLLLINLKSYW